MVEFFLVLSLIVQTPSGEIVDNVTESVTLSLDDCRARGDSLRLHFGALASYECVYRAPSP